MFFLFVYFSKKMCGQNENIQITLTEIYTRYVWDLRSNWKKKNYENYVFFNVFWQNTMIYI